MRRSMFALVYALAACANEGASSDELGSTGGHATESDSTTAATATSGTPTTSASTAVDGSTTATHSDSGDGTASDDSSGGDTGSMPDATPQCNDVPVPPHDDLTSPPLDPPPVAGDDVSFLSNWIALPASGGWRRTQIIDACRMHADGTLTWHGLPALRVEVDPGDDPLALGADSERAEVLVMQTPDGIEIYEGNASGTQYYATSYYFPADWDGTMLAGNENSWSAVMQLYPWGALWASRRNDGEPQRYALADHDFSDGGELALGRWTDLVLMIDWPTGALAVWRRDQDDVGFTQVIDATDDGLAQAADVYFKQGLYRGGDVGGRVDVLWIGPTARGTSFAAVEQAAFGTADGPG